MSFIKKIHIENFMSIANADIEFDGRNIIDLCGYNDSGKSAVIRLIDIMFYNAYSTEQVHFIRTGEDYFKCIMYFDDGVEYERIKMDTGASIFELRKDGVVVYNNQSGRQIINTGGIPKVIVDYLGVVKDDYTREELNVRRCTDRLFLINTTGGDNYKILNSILQSEALAETSTRLNTDKNKLQNEVVAKYNQLSALQTQRKETPVVPKSILDNLSESADILEEYNERFECIRGVKDDLYTYRDIKISPEVSLIDTEVLTELTEIMGYKESANISIPIKVSDIDIEVLNELSNIYNLKCKSNISVPIHIGNIDTSSLSDLQGLVKLKAEYDSIGVSGGVADTVSIDNYTDLHNLIIKYRDYCRVDNIFNEMDREYTGVYSKLSELADKYNLAICKNCGTVMVGGHTHE